jgi:hypothetical protein
MMSPMSNATTPTTVLGLGEMGSARAAIMAVPEMIGVPFEELRAPR